MFKFEKYQKVQQLICSAWITHEVLDRRIGWRGTPEYALSDYPFWVEETDLRAAIHLEEDMPKPDYVVG